MTKKTFDEILKQNAIDANGVDLFGYGINGRNYPLYYDCWFFAKFITEMMNDYHKHYLKYSAGKGSELKPQDSSPPKMSSVASSSRFCYLAFRNSDSVDFEHACPINKIKGTPPQMDAYFSNENIFVEVKCHEIFDNHKIEFSAQYYDLLFGANNDFDFGFLPADKTAAFEIPRSEFGINNEQTMIDIKQLICHLLGIKSHKKHNETATLLYLFFKPKTLRETQRKEINEVFEKLEKEIAIIFGDNKSPIKKFAEKNNIQLKAIAQYSEVMSPLTNENTIHLYP